jgi:uncharacterized protein YbgA (DUF1722 family)
MGIFARIFMERLPLIPVEDENSFHELWKRENFVEKIFTYQRWKIVTTGHKRLRDLRNFHTRHRYLILSHNPTIYAQMQKLIAGAHGLKPVKLFDRYGRLLMKAVSSRATVKKHTRVLKQIIRDLKKYLKTSEIHELMEVINSYYNGLVPLIVPITLINHYVRKYDQNFLKEQVYLNPDPLELKLKNHA